MWAPFNPNSVNFDILNKNKKKKEDSSTHNSNNNLTISSQSNSNNNQQLLILFERNVIPSQILQEFKDCQFAECWNGEESQKGLFESWRKLKELCGTKHKLLTLNHILN